VADATPLRRRAAIAGVGATRQGAHPGVDRYRLGLTAVREALDDAAIDKAEIDAVLTGQQFDGSGLHALTVARLLGVEPHVTNTLDYSTGGFTTQYAAMLVATGVCRVVLCVYARNPPGAMHELSGAIVEDRDYGLFNAGATAGLGWTQYSTRYGAGEETLGHVAVAARDHARLNPNAAFTEPLTLDGYLAQPHVLWPLRELDICKVTAGAAAVIVTTPERAREGPRRPVLFESVGRRQAPRRLEVDGHLLCLPMRDVARQAFTAAGLGPVDVDVLGISDASTVAVVQTLEHYGFCGEGEAPALVADGGIRLGGTIPVNTDGGQLSGGYLVGWLHQVELARQLRGAAGERQVAGAAVAMYTTTGTFREQYAATIYTAG
jgi:acetyl-CoA acetyltransferase